MPKPENCPECGCSDPRTILYGNDTETWQCSGCGHKWSEPYGTGRPQSCSKCGSMDVVRTDSARGQGGGRRWRGQGGGQRAGGTP